MTSKPVITTPVGNIEGIIQSITASAQSIVFPVAEEAAVLLQLVGDSVGHNSTFEGTTDGTNWFLIPAIRTDTIALLTATGVVAGNLAYGYWLWVSGIAAFRVRSTAHASGTATWRASYTDEEPEIPMAAVAATISGNPVLGAGTNLIGKVQEDANTSATGGATSARINATQTGANLKAAGGRLYGITVTNHSAAARYVHIYNKASAATLGTDTPVATIGLQAGQSQTVNFDVGIALATGISWAATTDNPAIPTTVATAGDVSGTFLYA